MNRMACPEAWAAMKACFVFMSSPPIERKKPRLCVELNLLRQPLVIPAKLHQFSGLGFLRRGRRGRARGLKLEPPGLQLRWRDAEIGSHTAMRRTRLRQPGNRVFLVFRRKSPPRLLCHLVPPGRYSIYRLVRDPGATSGHGRRDDTPPDLSRTERQAITNFLPSIDGLAGPAVVMGPEHTKDRHQRILSPFRRRFNHRIRSDGLPSPPLARTQAIRTSPTRKSSRTGVTPMRWLPVRSVVSAIRSGARKDVALPASA